MIISSWLKRWTSPPHVHTWTKWYVVTKVERLVGPLGVTESPVYYNERQCTECQFVELKRIKDRS